MQRPGGYLVRAVSVGLVSVTLFSVGIFLARGLIEGGRGVFIWPYALRHRARPTIKTTALIPEYEGEEKSRMYSRATLYSGDNILGGHFGLFDDVEDARSEFLDNHVVYASRGEAVYFDAGLGVFVYVQTSGRRSRWWGPPGRKAAVVGYAGRSGVADEVGELERFSERPAAGVVLGEPNDPPGLVVFDAEQERLVRYDFAGSSVTLGPEPNSDKVSSVIQIGDLRARVKRTGPREHALVRVDWCPPMVSRPVDTRDAIMPMELDYSHTVPWGAGFVPVLLADGTVHRVNVATLEFGGVLGRLPAPNRRAVSKVSRGGDPGELGDYEALPLFVDGEYRGLITGSMVWPEYRLGLAVFDKQGELVQESLADLRGESLDEPGGALTVFVEYLLDNFNAPLATIAGAVFGGGADSDGGPRALFVSANSLLGRWRLNHPEEPYGEKALIFFLLMLPGVLLSGLLARRVGRDGRQVGLSRRVRRWWVVATMLLGLPGYVTYRLTRPGVVQVSCQNCGRLRRPDFARCQHCRSGWEVAELAAPSWRMVDEEAGAFAERLVEVGRGDADVGAERQAGPVQEARGAADDT